MKRIISALWNEPVLAATVLNSIIAALATEGIVSGWIAVLCVAVSGPIVRYFVIPERKLNRVLERGDSYGGSN